MRNTWCTRGPTDRRANTILLQPTSQIKHAGIKYPTHLLITRIWEKSEGLFLTGRVFILIYDLCPVIMDNQILTWSWKYKIMFKHTSLYFYKRVFLTGPAELVGKNSSSNEIQVYLSHYCESGDRINTNILVEPLKLQRSWVWVPSLLWWHMSTLGDGVCNPKVAGSIPESHFDRSWVLRTWRRSRNL